MIRTNKVKIMTRAAAFEQKEGRKALYINQFFAADYVAYGLIKSAVSLTIAFGMAIAMWVVYHAEELMTEKSVEDLFAMGKNVLLLYGVMLVAYLLVSAAVYGVRYYRAQKRLKGYRTYLRRLAKTYQEEGSAKEKIV